MKRVLTFALLLAISLALAIIGQFQNHPALVYIGMSMGALIILSLIVYLIKFLFHFIGINVSSFVFMLVLGGIAGVLIWHGFTSPFMGYVIGVAVGLFLTIFTLRKIGVLAQTSTIFGEVFGFLTGYKVKAYVARQSIISKDDMDDEHADRQNIVLILNQQLGFSKRESRELAEYAIEHAPNASIEDKVKSALQYKGSLN